MILFPFQRPFPLDAGFAGSLAAISKVCSSKTIILFTIIRCLSESDENPYTWSEESGSPRGKALGGTSVLHFGMYVRGRPRDFDGWGFPGWGYREMLRAFKKSEDFKV